MSRLDNLEEKTDSVLDQATAPEEATIPRPVRFHSRRLLEYSVIVPVYNEAACLEELYQRLNAVMRSCSSAYEILFVDDGSSDGSLELIRRFSASNPKVRYISFTRNFGQAAALTAGQVAAAGKVVISIDSDLQNPPEEIPRLIEALRQGFDVAYGIRRHRQDPWHRRFGSRCVSWFLRRATGMSAQTDVTAFVASDRRFVEELNRCPEYSRFHPALFAWLGARITRVEVNHAPRLHGESKYNFTKLCHRALDLVTTFSLLPIHLLGYAGIIIMLTAMAAGMAGLVSIAMSYRGSTAILAGAAVLLLVGVQLTAVAVVGQYLGRAFVQLTGRPLYLIRETDPRLPDWERLRFPQNSGIEARPAGAGVLSLVAGNTWRAR